jgi:hypothetical protein
LILTDLKRILTDLKRVLSDLKRVLTDLKRVLTDLKKVLTDLKRAMTETILVENQKTTKIYSKLTIHLFSIKKISPSKLSILPFRSRKHRFFFF